MNIRAITDIETGGFSRTRNGVVEIAILFIDENFQIIDQFSSLVLPYHKNGSAELMEYTESAEKIHGYSVETLRTQGKPGAEICDEIDALIEQHGVTEFIGHNIEKFDHPRLVDFWERFSMFDAEKRFPVTIDTMTAARNDLNSQSYSLEKLCEGLGIEHENAHQALADCMATMELAKYLEL